MMAGGGLSIPTARTEGNWKSRPMPATGRQALRQGNAAIGPQRYSGRMILLTGMWRATCRDDGSLAPT